MNFPKCVRLLDEPVYLVHCMIIVGKFQKLTIYFFSDSLFLVCQLSDIFMYMNAKCNLNGIKCWFNSLCVIKCWIFSLRRTGLREVPLDFLVNVFGS